MRYDDGSTQREDVCRKFEQAWQRGELPDLENHLPADAETRRHLLPELLRIDLEHHLVVGLPCPLEDYPQRFPDLDESAFVALIAFDYELRHRQAGPTPEDYLNRFPHLRERLLAWFHAAPPAHSPSARLLPHTAGPLVVGKYELLDPLGSGAFAIVYRGRDRELQRTVAVKMPRHGPLATPEAGSRLLREARSIARLRHPGIVTLLDAVEQDGLFCLVSEFIEGGTLAQRLADGRLPPREAAGLIAAVADALDHAHRQGIIHRDIKPSNILLDSAGQPRLADFGLAHCDADSTLTSEGRVLGTLAYMAPEQARGDSHRADVRADVYGLGAVFYECLTGEPPFRGRADAVLRHLLEDEPQPPRSVQPDISRDLECICLKCLEKEPARRYASAAALAADLRSFLGGQLVQARPLTAARRLERWVQRRPALASLMAVVVLLSATGVGGVLWQWHRAEVLRQQAETHLKELQQQQTATLQQFLHAHRALTEFMNPPDATDVERQFTRQALLMRGERYYQEFLQLRQADAEPSMEVVHAHLALVQIHLHQGAREPARDQARLAIAAAERLHKRLPSETSQYALASAWTNLGHAVEALGDLDQALICLDQARAVMEKLCRQTPVNSEYHLALARVEYMHGSCCNRKAQSDRALSSLNRARSLLEELAHQQPDSLQRRQLLASCYSGIAFAHRSAQRQQEADQFQALAGQEYERLLQEHPRESLYREQLADFYRGLGQANRGRKDHNAAMRDYQRARELYIRLAQDNPALPYYRNQWANCSWGLANSANDLNQPTEAVRHCQECARLWESLWTEQAGNLDFGYALANTYALEGRMHDKLNKPLESLRCNERSAAVYQELLRAQPQNVKWRERLAARWFRIGKFQRQFGRLEEALETWRKEIQVLELLQKDNPGKQYREDLGLAWQLIGETLEQSGKRDAAVTAYREAVTVFRAAAEKTPDAAQYQQLLSNSSASLNRLLQN